jgi:hypothetical protein
VVDLPHVVEKAREHFSKTPTAVVSVRAGGEVRGGGRSCCSWGDYLQPSTGDESCQGCVSGSCVCDVALIE